MRMWMIIGIGLILSLMVTVLLGKYTPLGGWAALTAFVTFLPLCMSVFYMWPIDVYTRLILDEIKLGKVNSDGTFKVGTLRLVCLNVAEDTGRSRVELRDGRSIVLWVTPTTIAAHRIDDALNSLKRDEGKPSAKTGKPSEELDLALINRIKGVDKCSPT